MHNKPDFFYNKSLRLSAPSLRLFPHFFLHFLKTTDPLSKMQVKVAEKKLNITVEDLTLASNGQEKVYKISTLDGMKNKLVAVNASVLL